MNTPSVVVICESGTPIALAFSRSIVTSTCGSLAENVVVRPVRSLRARLAATIWWAMRSRSVSVFLP